MGSFPTVTDSRILAWTLPTTVVMAGMRAYAGDIWWLLGAKLCLSIAACCVVAVWFRR